MHIIEMNEFMGALLPNFTQRITVETENSTMDFFPIRKEGSAVVAMVNIKTKTRVINGAKIVVFQKDGVNKLGFSLPQFKSRFDDKYYTLRQYRDIITNNQLPQTANFVVNRFFMRLADVG